MNDAMIVSRWIIGAAPDREYLAKLRRATPNARKGDMISMSVMETTVSRGTRVQRVLCCWAGGDVAKDGQILISLVGEAAVNALMRLPACMDGQLAEQGRLVFRQLKIGATPLRDKVIDAVLEALPGDRLCFIGDLAGELNGKMGVTFNIQDGEPIFLEDQE